MKTLISLIKIGDRQRQDLGDLAGLRLSMAEFGLINPILIDSDYNLVAGNRRLRCALELGWLEIDTVIREALSPSTAQVLELDENILRKDNTWQENAIALYRLHNLRKTEDGWTLRKMQECYGLSIGHLSEVLQVAKCLVERRGSTNEKDIALWNSSSVKDAVIKLLEENEKAARAELDKRLSQRETSLPPSPGVVHVVNTTEEKEAPITTIFIHDNIIASEVKCFLGFDLPHDLVSDLPFPLYKGIPGIVWCRGIGTWLGLREELSNTDLRPCGFPLIWNRTNGSTWFDNPFVLSYYLGLYVENSYKQPSTKCKIPSVITATVPKDFEELPVQVVQQCLDAMCEEGDLAMLPGKNPPVIQVAQCDRVPVWDGTLPGNEGLRAKLESWHRQQQPNVTFSA